MIEAELLTLYEKAFKKLEIEIIIKYNSRNLMNGLILESGVKKELLSSVTTIVDKIEKLSKEEFINYLKEYDLTQKQIEFLLQNFNLSLKELNDTYANTSNENIIKGLNELNELTNYLKDLGIDNICKFTSSLARGQNYYTGNVFEVYEKNGRIGGSIGAGGRYDKMITNFIDDGNEYPAVGISFGLSSIYEHLKNDKRFEENSNIDIFVIPMNTNVESLKLANGLRELGYKVDIEMRNKKLRKSLDYANKEKIPYVIILGEDEVQNNFFMIKDMFGNNEIKIDSQNIQMITKIIN